MKCLVVSKGLQNNTNIQNEPHNSLTYDEMMASKKHLKSYKRTQLEFSTRNTNVDEMISTYTVDTD